MSGNNERLFLMPAGNASDCEERGHEWLTWDTEPPRVACSHCGLRQVTEWDDPELHWRTYAAFQARRNIGKGTDHE